MERNFHSLFFVPPRSESYEDIIGPAEAALPQSYIFWHNFRVDGDPCVGSPADRPSVSSLPEHAPKGPTDLSAEK